MTAHYANSATPIATNDEHLRLASITPSGSPFDAWRLPRISVNEFWSQFSSCDQPSLAQMRYLAALALLAPTTHNTVPERFELRLQSKTLRVWLDRTAILPESDAQGRQATISCGCVLSFLTIAAQAFGLYETFSDESLSLDTTKPFSDYGERYTAIRSTTYEQRITPTRGIEWVSAMFSRKTLRAEYSPNVMLNDATFDGMRTIVSKFSTVELHVLTDAPTLFALGKFQELADTIVFNRAAFARELGDWLRPNDDIAYVGMRGREYGLDDNAARHFHRGLRGEERLLPDEGAALAKASSRGMRSASAVVVLTVNEDNVLSRLQAGQAFGELLLYLEIHGWSTAIHAGITEVDAPNLALRGRLRTSRRPVVVFRVGKPLAPQEQHREHSARPKLDDVLVSPSSTR